jgi:broad specificity phosphatase PhoE
MPHPLLPHPHENPPHTSTIVSSFQQGEEYYYEYIFSQKTVQSIGDDMDEEVYQKNFLRTMAIELFLQCLDYAMPSGQQNIRIQSLFFLVKLYHDEGNVEKMKQYFYRAVELIDHYYGKDFHNTPEWKNLISIYLEYINPELNQTFPTQYIPLLTPLLIVRILSESRERIQQQLEQVEDVLRTGVYDGSHTSIIEWLEDIFGPMRIFISSEEGDGLILNHWFPRCVWSLEWVTGINIHHNTTVDIFDKKARYRVTVDRWWIGTQDTFSSSHLEHIIYPILDIYIRKKEYILFADASDHWATIKWYEEQAELHEPMRDYTSFIRRTFSQYRKGYTEEEILSCQRSVDICRIVTLQYARGNHISTEVILQEIDTLLWWTIQRDILMLVQSHLMTRHETMNGTGYPFSLTKNNIPLQSRIYVIIRAYEALYSIYGYYPNKILSILEDWAEWWYFDADILIIFLEMFWNPPDKMESLPKRSESIVSLYRSDIYVTYMSRWQNIMDQIWLIEQDYDRFRAEHTDHNSQSSIAKSMNEWILALRRMADIRTIIIVTRHWATESDAPWGPPGDDGEHITEEGKQTSRDKWDILEGIDAHIFSSPIIRSMESAHIICQRVHMCMTDSCTPCTYVQQEEVLKNPPKDRENGRYNSYAQKLFQDNTGGLMELLIDTVSSSDESTNLYITHRDTWRHLIFWLNNLFSQDTTWGKKTPIENDTILVYFFQWDICIPWNLCFSLFDWKILLHEMTMISNEVFGTPFYEVWHWKIDLIQLHDRFLDFIDYRREYSSQDFSEFQRRLGENPLTRHFLEFLKT